MQDTVPAACILAAEVKKKRLSRVWIARTIGVKSSTVAAWIAGRGRPSALHAYALFVLLGIPVEAWLTEAERAGMQGLLVEAFHLRQRAEAAERGETLPDPRQTAWPWGARPQASASS